MPATFYEELTAAYRGRRDVLCGALAEAGFRCTPPEGAYYVMAEFDALSALDDVGFSTWLTREVGVAPVPGSSFYSRPEEGSRVVRFAFCKTIDLLEEAAARLQEIRVKT